MTAQQRDEFLLYLEKCTDSQVFRILQTEREAQRNDFAALAKTELKKRGVAL